MSVSFVEPDLQKLRLEHKGLQKNDSAILDDECDGDNVTYRLPRSDTPASIAVNNNDIKLVTSNASLSSNYTTISNTNTNSLSFRRLSTSSFDTAKTAVSSIQEPHENSYKKRISFDTSADDFSAYSICCKHVQHETNYWSRTFLLSLNKTYKKSLKWLLENVLEDGDDLICLKYEYERDKAEELLKEIISIVKRSKLKLKIIIEIALSGSIKSIVNRTMMLYQPALVVVSTTTKTYSNVMRYMTRRKTLSNYLLNHSPVPVIVVIADNLKQKDLEETEIAPTTTVSTSSTLSSEDYLNSLINRDIVESNEPDLENPIAYKSLFQSVPLEGKASSYSGKKKDLSPSITQQSVPISNVSSTNLSTHSPITTTTTSTTTISTPPSSSTKKVSKSWSKKFIPKSLRRFSSKS